MDGAIVKRFTIARRYFQTSEKSAKARRIFRVSDLGVGDYESQAIVTPSPPSPGLPARKKRT
jgi:hypothetical protein